MLPLFTIVRFGNTACDADVTARNGTCYTAAECASKGGTSSGTCASGFGVCCTFDGERVVCRMKTRVLTSNPFSIQKVSERLRESLLQGNMH